MRKMKQWPFGLLDDVFRCGTMKIVHSHDLVKSVEFAVNSLDEKFAVVLYERYKYGLTLDAISQRHGLSKEKTRNIIEKGLRMLRHPSNVQIIQYGVPGFLQVERNGEGDIETVVLQDTFSLRNNS